MPDYSPFREGFFNPKGLGDLTAILYWSQPPRVGAVQPKSTDMAKVKNKSHLESSVRPEFRPTSGIYANPNIYKGKTLVKFRLKFNTKCFETNVPLLKGEMVCFDKLSRKIFSLKSMTYAYSI